VSAGTWRAMAGDLAGVLLAQLDGGPTVCQATSVVRTGSGFPGHLR
jgi:hypothetical protein